MVKDRGTNANGGDTSKPKAKRKKSDAATDATNTEPRQKDTAQPHDATVTAPTPPEQSASQDAAGEPQQAAQEPHQDTPQPDIPPLEIAATASTAAGPPIPAEPTVHVPPWRLQRKEVTARKWIRKWVQVPSIIGKGKLQVLKWVPEGNRTEGIAMDAQQYLQHHPNYLPQPAGAADAQLPPAAAAAISAAAMAIAAEVAAAAGQGEAAAAATAAVAAAAEAKSSAEAADTSKPAAAAAAAAPPPPLTVSADDVKPNSMGLYECNYPGCPKVFASLGSLRRHMHSHGEKTFVCEHPGCGKAFVDAGRLQRHKLSHEEPTFRCTFPGCTKSFILEAKLRNHVTKVHGQALAAMTSLTHVPAAAGKGAAAMEVDGGAEGE